MTATAGNGGAYAVQWGTLGSVTLSLAGATATGFPAIILVESANASGFPNLTVSGAVNTGSGNIELAADDAFVDSAAIGGAGFSGQVVLAANRDEGNGGTLTMTSGSGSITTSNTSVYNNTGTPSTSTPGAVLLEDYSVTGTLGGVLTLGNITVGTGGSITVTTLPTLGVYDPAASAGAADIVAGNTSVVLTAPGGTVNLTAALKSGTTAIAGIGTSASPIKVSAANVVITDTSSATVATGSVFVTGTSTSNTNFAATVANTTAAGTVNLVDNGGAMTINGTTSTAGGGGINLTDSATGGNITVSGPLGSSTSGAIAINAGTNTLTFTSPQTFASNDPFTITAAASNVADFQSNVTVSGITPFAGTNGIAIDTGSTLAWGTAGATINVPTTVINSGTIAPTAGTFGTLTTAALTLGSSTTTQVNVMNTGAGNFSAISVNGTATLAGNLQVNVTGAKPCRRQHLHDS